MTVEISSEVATCFRKSDLNCARGAFQVAYISLEDRRTSGLARFGV